TLTHSKMTTVINNQLYIKEIINKEKLDDIQQKITLKKDYCLYIAQILQEIFEQLPDYKVPKESIIESGKSIEWSIEYDKNFKNISIKAQKINNSTLKEELSAAIDETFEYCKLLNNNNDDDDDDDLIIITKNHIQILSV